MQLACSFWFCWCPHRFGVRAVQTRADTLLMEIVMTVARAPSTVPAPEAQTAPTVALGVHQPCASMSVTMLPTGIVMMQVQELSTGRARSARIARTAGTGRQGRTINSLD